MSDLKNGILTVILTTYNAERFITETVDSILRQTMAQFTFIIVDDGSSDGTIGIIEQYNDPRIRLVKGEHRGKPSALNLGLMSVESEFVAFIDHDDVAESTRLERQYHFLNEHREVGLLSSWYVLCDEHGVQRRGIKAPVVHEEIEWMMTMHCSMRFPGLMMRTALIQQYGGFDESLTNGTDDYEYFLRLLPVTKFHNLPEYLLFHRRHSDSFSYRSWQEQNNAVRQLSRDYLNTLMQNDPSLAGIITFRLGLSEYYHGSMKTARHYFLQSLHSRYIDLRLFRYYFPTLLGDRIFRLFRRFYNRYRLNY
jgi:glycosyltransferase involved in cell wall biosynthesis